MSGDPLRSFAEFWPYYVGEHRSPLCRGLHYSGTLLGSACALAVAATLLPPLFLLLALLLGYGSAWIGHFLVEHNRPATFRYPLWSLAADYKMLGLAVRGRMAAEVTRLYGSPAPERSAPLRVPR